MSMAAKRTSQRWRQATVWLHVVTSVGWMGQALALFTLLTMALTTDDPATRISATSMAHVLDTVLLAPLANASAFTGFMLAASTAWGYFRHWWVLAKFAITLVQLYAGIFLLSGALRDSVVAARAGEPQPVSWQLPAGTALMASGLAFQAWLSVTKPWAKTRFARTAKPTTAPAWVFVAVLLAPIVDTAVGLALGYPLPALSAVVLVVWHVRRQRRTVVTTADQLVRSS